jgi:hypothetical protein
MMLRKSRSRADSTGTHKKSSGKAAYIIRSEAIAIDGAGGEPLEWIDEKNTDLVSPTIKVASLHTTNSQLNNLLNK